MERLNNVCFKISYQELCSMERGEPNEHTGEFTYVIGRYHRYYANRVILHIPPCANVIHDMVIDYLRTLEYDIPLTSLQMRTDERETYYLIEGDVITVWGGLPKLGTYIFVINGSHFVSYNKGIGR